MSRNEHVGSGRHGFGYQPALDGLRAVAVLAVIAYHLGYGWARGGFLGVDTFFVLSGYLITSLLLVEFAGARRIDLRAFWARRARRLLPALLLVLGAVTVWAAARAAAGPAREPARRRARDPVLRSELAVRGQRPVLLRRLLGRLAVAPRVVARDRGAVLPASGRSSSVACLRLARGRTRLLGRALHRPARRRRSCSWRVLYDPADPSRAYYGTDTRAHALLIGALLAIVLQRQASRVESRAAGPAGPRPPRTWSGSRPRRCCRASVVGAAIACVAAFALVPDTQRRHVPRRVCVVRGRRRRPDRRQPSRPDAHPSGRCSRSVPCVGSGRSPTGCTSGTGRSRSRSTAPRTGIDGAALDVVRIATTFALATLSFYLVERPIRRGVLGRRAFVATPLAFAGVVSAVLLVAATALPPPSYLRNNGDTSIAPRCTASTVIASARHRPTRPRRRRRRPPTRPPHPRRPCRRAGSAVDRPHPAPAGHLRRAPAAARRRLGDGEPATGAALRPRRRRGIDLASVAVPGCGTVAGEPLGPGDARYSWTAGCGRNIPGLETSAVAQDRPDLVVWLSSWEGADRILGRSDRAHRDGERLPDDLRPRRPGGAAAHVDGCARRVPDHAAAGFGRRRRGSVGRGAGARTG